MTHRVFFEYRESRLFPFLRWFMQQVHCLCKRLGKPITESELAVGTPSENGKA